MGYAYKSGLGLVEPVVLPGQYVVIHHPGGVKPLFKQVDFFEAIAPFQCLDIGVIAAQTMSARTAVTNLQLGDSEFGQYRWFPIDNAQIRLFLPAAIAKMQLRNLQVPMDMQIVDRDPCLHLTEFFVWRNYAPAMEGVNFMDYALGACRIIAFGFRFATMDVDPEIQEKIVTGALPATRIWATGRSTG